MPERRTVSRPKVPEPVEPAEFTVSFTGVADTKWYACPTCGRNGQDKDQIARHIAEHGGEE